MNILLINPPISGKVKYIREGRCEQRLSSFQYMMPPISLPSIAAVLEKEKFGVKILECIGEDLNFSDVKNEIRNLNLSFIVINVSTATYYNDLEIVRLIKETINCHITAIGVHVSALPDVTLQESLLDSVIVGEPEMTCLDLAKAIEGKQNLREIRSISFKHENKIICNPARDFIEDLDSLPFPDRSLIDNNKYTLPNIDRPYTLLISSRGCPYECIFCTARQYYGKKIRLRSAKNIVDEAEEIMAKFGLKDIVMWSDTFTLVRDHVLEICDEIHRRGVKFNWMCNSRVDKVDEIMLEKMKAAGCIGISYGIESGVQHILDNAKKGINLRQIDSAFKWTKRAGIETLGHVIFGLPGETKATIRNTLDFVKKIKPDFAQFYCAIPFPGTEFYSLCKEKGWLVTKDWSRFEINQAIIQTSRLSVNDLSRARRQAFLSFYIRPSYIIKRAIPVFFSNNRRKTMLQVLNFFKEWAY